MEISIVIPCFNEEEVLPLTVSRLKKALAEWTNDFEVIFIDDGSTDKTWELIKNYCKEDPRLKGVKFSRNFGQESAVVCGVELAKGEKVAIIDADLQDPPELLKQMVEEVNKGFDVVYGQRKFREGETFFKKFTANLFYKTMNFLSETKIPENASNFRVINNKARNAFLKVSDRNIFVRGVFSWIGFKQKPLIFDRPARAGGETKYPSLRMFKLALAGIILHSKFPLRFSLLLAIFLLISILIQVALSVFELIEIRSEIILTQALFFLNFIVLWLMGEYVGHILDQTLKRPFFLIDEVTDNLNKL